MPGQIASLLVTFQSSCGNAGPGTAVVADRIRLARGGAILDVPIERVSLNPACPSTISSLFDPNAAQTQSPYPIEARVRLPVQASRGATVTYFVTLTNWSATAFPPPGTCPRYEQILSLGPAKPVDQWLSLNCAATPIPVGSSQTYEMRIVIPYGTQADTAKLSWRLVGDTDIAFAGGTVEID
jgi:hypothetical protein